MLNNVVMVVVVGLIGFGLLKGCQSFVKMFGKKKCSECSGCSSSSCKSK